MSQQVCTKCKDGKVRLRWTYHSVYQKVVLLCDECDERLYHYVAPCLTCRQAPSGPSGYCPPCNMNVALSEQRRTDARANAFQQRMRNTPPSTECRNFPTYYHTAPGMDGKHVNNEGQVISMRNGYIRDEDR